jgi:NAD(P)-dependent dehydrogenase (short-subunit alcohol dehydrogenase family)
MGELDGRVAVITGGANGIGRATARLLAGDGALVVIGDIESDTGREAAEEIDAITSGAFFVETDVFRYQDLERLVNEAVSRLGRIDFMINNAGSTGTMHGIPNQPVWELQPQHIDWIVGLNLRHQMYGSKAAAPAMIEQGSGLIINFSSAAAFVHPLDQSVYAGAKAGVVAFTRTLAKDLGKYGVRANVVAPGITATRVWQHQLDGRAIDQVLASMGPYKRAGKPEEVAEVVRFLCSPRACRINGETIRVDGGL